MFSNSIQCGFESHPGHLSVAPMTRRWCTEALDLLGISWRQASWKTLSVARHNDVRRLDDLLGLMS
jgi:hypothetical protein